MKSIFVMLLAVVVLLPLAADATDVEGDVWGLWTKDNSPYNVIGEIRVPPESTLVIEPGVLVNFQGHHKFIVDSLATLLAVGSETDSIKFTAEDPDSGWHGIRFIYADSNSEISYCRLEYGKAIGGWPDNCGGAIYCSYSSPTISNSTLFGNSAEDRGAAIYCQFCSSTIALNTISANSASHGGGGIFCRESTVTIRDNSITYNSAEAGGGIYCAESDPVISDNYIRGNGALYGGGIYCWRSSPTISTNTILKNMTVLGGGGIRCDSSSSPTISNNIIRENDDGGIYCYHYSSPMMSNNTINENQGTGIHCYYYSNPVIRNNTISQNFRADLGGGICCQYHSSPKVMNNIISGNSADEGGGILCTNFCDPTISNNTITANSADSGGGIGCKYYSDATITNTILWGDAAPEGPEIYVYNSDPAVSYCDVQGGWPGQGNIDIDPLFRDPTSSDFHLMADYCGDPDNSPCIDAGHPDSLDVQLDCFHGLGTDRADMGAYGGRNSGWPTGIDDDEDDIPIIPRQFLLLQNYPNPFNAMTIIEYQLPASNYVKMEICNILGQRVITLVDERQQAGYKSIIWNASDVSSGLYFYKLTAGERSYTRKMMLVR